MTEYDMRLLPDDECIFFVRGQEAIRDKKCFPWLDEFKKEYKRATSLGYYDYYLDYDKDKSREEPLFMATNEAEYDYYLKMAEKDSSISIIKMDGWDFMNLDLDELMEEATENESIVYDFEKIKEQIEEENQKQRNISKRKFEEEFDHMTMFEIYRSEMLDEVRKNVITEMQAKQIPFENVKEVIHPKYSSQEVLKNKQILYELLNIS